MEIRVSRWQTAEVKGSRLQWHFSRFVERNVSIACEFRSAGGDGLFQETNPLTFYQTEFHAAWYGSRRGIRLEVKRESRKVLNDIVGRRAYLYCFHQSRRSLG